MIIFVIWEERCHGNWFWPPNVLADDGGNIFGQFLGYFEFINDGGALAETDGAV